VVLDAEVAESGVAPEEIRARIARTLSVMRAAIDEGLRGEVRSPPASPAGARAGSGRTARACWGRA
jgi:L-serine deaminase